MKHLKDWNKFDDGHGLSGTEGRWIIDNDILYIFLEPTNHFMDWIRNVFGALFPIFRHGKLYHRYWYRNAEWVMKYLIDLSFEEDFEDMKFLGYSKGGAEAAICDAGAFGISAPIPYFGKVKGKRIYRRWDIVPFVGMIGKWENNKKLPKKSNLFWKNHIFTYDELNDLIKEEYT